MKALSFHIRHAWFNICEQFSDLASVFAECLLIPFFIWLICQLWAHFNASQGNYTLQEIILYVAFTESLYMTFLRSHSFSRASSDFSLALARPRSWLTVSFSGIYGRCFGLRLIYLFFVLIVAPFTGISLEVILISCFRLFLLLPILGVFQALLGTFFACLQVLWTEVTYFILPVGKIFLALGGVFGPLVDFREPWRQILLQLPASDLFFQPAHFCVKGSFYQTSFSVWLFRMVLHALVLGTVNFYLFRFCKHRHQSYGG
jgi:hypothetical protein